MANYLLNGEETDRLLFRAVQLSDYKEWLPFFTNPATTRHWIADYEEPVQACTNWYNKQLHRYATEKEGMNALIEKATGKLVGHCGLLLQTVDEVTELEIAYSLLPMYWNKGYATEAAARCKAYAFAHNFSASLISIISLTNLPSENVARKIGMTLDKTTVYNANRVNIFRVTA